MFFVATAPVGAAGHINLSPKGLDALTVLGPREVLYLDCTGSGAETIAHVRENGRIVVMFCAFEGPPKIVRLQGHAEVIEPGDERFSELRDHFDPALETRSLIRIDVNRVSDSCGFGVPRFTAEGPRTQLKAWADQKSEDELRSYHVEKNARSIDGMPALRWVTPEEST